MPRWESIYGALTLKHGLTASTPPAEAAAKVAAGTHILVDVRPPDVAARASPAGAANVPLYRKFDPRTPGAWAAGPGAVAKAALLALNGVTPTMQNPSFVEDVLAAAAGRAVLVLCETGGSLVPTAAFSAGKPSRSLQAAFRLLEDGRAPAVGHVDGGAFAWNVAGLPFDGGRYDGKDAGRTPGVVQGREEAKRG
jgi:rhodanese-related sulfurtransferase